SYGDWSSDVCSSDLALQGGVQPAVRVAHRKPVFVSEVLVYFDGVCVGACNVWICGQEIRGNKRIIVIRGKSSQGFQYACGVVQRSEERRVGKECSAG